MNLLMISGDRTVIAGKRGAFYYTLEQLTKHFERIDVITPRVPCLQPSPFPHAFLHPSPHGLWYQPRWIAKQGMALLDAHRHAIMTVHEYPPFYNGMGARYLHRQTGVPFVLEIHHIVGYPIPASLEEYTAYAMAYTYLRRHARKAAAVRVVNREVASILHGWGIPESKIALVPSFYLDTEVIQGVHSIEKRFDLVFAGRLVANKGLLELLSAMRLLPGKTLLIVGDGPLRRRSAQIARELGIGDRVTFAGWLPTQEDVLRAICSASVFVLPSKSEGGPRVALEAMALGMPIVTTQVGVMPDVVDDGVNGLFTDGTPENLAESIRLLVGDAALRTRLGNAAKSVSERFERSEAVAQYAHFLQSLAS